MTVRPITVFSAKLEQTSCNNYLRNGHYTACATIESCQGLKRAC